MNQDRYNNIIQETKHIFGDNIIYLVGGAVRDLLMNIEPKDFDFVTPLSPDQIEQCIRNAGRKPYLIGKRFGTIGFTVSGEKVEITTYRTEKYLPDNRKPEVTFCNTLKDDLSRRDFTINAITMDLNGNVYDPYNGREDGDNKIIRCVGNPIKRFREDPLRLLRAIRFSTQLNFKIEENTYNAIIEKNYKILNISKERWMEELNKILLSDNVTNGLELLMNTSLLNYIIPELSLQYNFNQESPYHVFPLWNHTLGVVANTPKDLYMRWAALLHDVAKPFLKKYNAKKGYYNYIKHDLLGAEIVEKTAKYLKWSNDMTSTVKSLVLNHMQDDCPLRKADRFGKVLDK